MALALAEAADIPLMCGVNVRDGRHRCFGRLLRSHPNCVCRCYGYRRSCRMMRMNVLGCSCRMSWRGVSCCWNYCCMSTLGGYLTARERLCLGCCSLRGLAGMCRWKNLRRRDVLSGSGSRDAKLRLPSRWMDGVRWNLLCFHGCR